MEKKPLLIEIQCFGNILWWVKLIKGREVVFEEHEHFQKSGYRNRYMVLGANGVINLSVPIAGGREIRALTCNVGINNSQNWQKNHWKTLESCYNKSPFFFHYAPALKGLFEKKYDRLWDFNLDAFKWVLKQLKVSVDTRFTENYLQPDASFPFEDWRGRLKASQRTDYIHKPYFQVFDRGFQKNLSILDILFNLGPETTSYLTEQTTI